MKITKLTSTDAFVVVDLEGADRAAGIARWAKKLLQGGAVNLARHLTYGFAAMGIEASGASACINSDPDGRSAAIGAFTTEAAGLGVRLDPGKGLSADDLAALAATDDRSPLARELHAALLAAGALGALEGAIGSVAGAAVAIEGTPTGGSELAARLADAGATVTNVDAGVLDAPCDVLVVGSKVGAVDHENAPAIAARTLLPLTPLPITARGLATSTRAGVTVLPDFVSLGGPLVAFWPAAGSSPEDLLADAGGRARAAVASVADHPEGPFLGACETAEAFLLTWQDTLPFGRPIA